MLHKCSQEEEWTVKKKLQNLWKKWEETGKTDAEEDATEMKHLALLSGLAERRKEKKRNFMENENEISIDIQESLVKQLR